MPRLFSLILLFSLLGTACAQNEPVSIEDAWVREGPPGMAMLAGFMVVKNSGKQDRSIVGAEGPDYDHIELHRSIVDEGMARMMPQESILVPAGGSVALKPGDYHLMLMQPKRQIKAGDHSQITLILDDNTRLTVNAPVKKPEGGMTHQHDQHDQHHQHH